MLIEELFIYLLIAALFIIPAAIRKDKRFLIPAAAILFLTGLFIVDSGIQVETGTETKIPAPTTRQSSAAMAGSLDEFGYMVTKEYDTVFDLESTKPVSIRRDYILEDGTGGSVDNTAGEYEIDPNANGLVRLRTAEQSAYSSGKTAAWGIGVRTPPNFNTSTGTWTAGNYEMDNGMFIGQDKNGTFVGLRYNGSVVEKTYRENWNGNNEPINFSSGVIVQGRWVYYGYGGPMDAVFYVLDDQPSTDVTTQLPELRPVHRFNVDGRVTFTSTSMPVTAEVNSSTGTHELYVGGRHFSMEGKYNVLDRITTEQAEVTVTDSTDWVQVVTFRQEPGGQDTRATINGFSALAGCDAEWQWRIHRADNISNADWRTADNVPENESLLQVDTNGTVPDMAGIEVDSGYLTGQKNDFGVGGAGINTQMPQHLLATLYFKPYSDVNNCVISSKARMAEAW